MNEWMIYLLLKLDSVLTFFQVTSVFLAILEAIILFSWLSDSNYYKCEKDKHAKRKPAIIVAVALFFCLMGGILTPTTKEALLIYGVPKLLDSQKVAIEQAGEIPAKVVKILNKYLDEQAEGVKE